MNAQTKNYETGILTEAKSSSNVKILYIVE